MSEEKREVIFADGFIFKKPGEKAPDFIKAEIAIKADEFIAFLNKHKKSDGWVNLNVKKSKAGKLYTDLDSWTPPKKDEGLTPADVPFRGKDDF